MFFLLFFACRLHCFLLLCFFCVSVFLLASLFFCLIASAATAAWRRALATQTTRATNTKGTTRTTKATQTTKTTRTKNTIYYYNGTGGTQLEWNCLYSLREGAAPSPHAPLQQLTPCKRLLLCVLGLDGFACFPGNQSHNRKEITNTACTTPKQRLQHQQLLVCPSNYTATTTNKKPKQKQTQKQLKDRGTPHVNFFQ